VAVLAEHQGYRDLGVSQRMSLVGLHKRSGQVLRLESHAVYNVRATTTATRGYIPVKLRRSASGNMHHHFRPADSKVNKLFAVFGIYSCVRHANCETVVT
jgi:hypothetical protein